MKSHCRNRKSIHAQNRRPKRVGRPFGFNVIGYVSRNLGLSVMSRNLIRLLLDKKYPVAVHDLNPGKLFIREYDSSYKQYFVNSCDDLPYSVNFFTVPFRDATEFLFSDLSNLLHRRKCLNIFCPMWELTVLPTIWIKAAQLCDVIVAQSDFIRSTCENYLPDMPIISADHPLYFPQGVKPSRSRFGLPEGAIIFIFSFEPRSDTERKNPFAVINAFRRAFRGISSAHLVIKINNGSYSGRMHPAANKIRGICVADERIHVITEDLTYPEVLSLYASCDVYVSLHRSEGLGLGPMEAMQLGKPVIATAWSGNMTYMNRKNACLVNYRFIPALGKIKCYNQQFMGKDTFWADPDIEEAASWMRKLAADARLRKKIGKRAAADMDLFQKRAKKGYFIQEILKILEDKRADDKKS